MAGIMKEGVLGKRRLNSRTEINLVVTVWTPFETGHD
jgi:hypothetical protein